MAVWIPPVNIPSFSGGPDYSANLYNGLSGIGDAVVENRKIKMAQANADRNYALEQQQYALGLAKMNQPKETWSVLSSPSDLTAAGLGAADAGKYQIGSVSHKITPISGSGVNITTPFETQRDKDLGSGEAKQILDYNAGAAKGNAQISDIQLMRQLTKNPNFYSGAGGDLILKGKKLFIALGGDPDIAASNENFTALANQLVFTRLGSLGNQISEGDRNFIYNTIPNISMTPEGITRLLDTQEALAKRDIEVAQLAQQWQVEHGGRLDAGFQEYLSQWAEAHPLFSEGGAVAPPGTGGSFKTKSGIVITPMTSP